LGNRIIKLFRQFICEGNLAIFNLDYGVQGYGNFIRKAHKFMHWGKCGNLMK